MTLDTGVMKWEAVTRARYPDPPQPAGISGGQTAAVAASSSACCCFDEEHEELGDRRGVHVVASRVGGRGRGSQQQQLIRNIFLQTNPLNRHQFAPHWLPTLVNFTLLAFTAFTDNHFHLRFSLLHPGDCEERALEFSLSEIGAPNHPSESNSMTQDEARAEGRVARSVGRSQSQKAPHYMHDNRGDYESPTSRRIGISNRNRRDGERWVRGVVLGESKAEPEPDVDMGMVEPEEEGVGDERGEEEGVGDEHGEEEEEEHEHEQVGNVENIEAVQKAAALLANLPSLFQGLCEPCFGLLQTRLSEIASG